MANIEIQEEDLRFKFYHMGRFGLAYNKGFHQYGDFYLSRPNFFPVYSPSGRQVATSSAYRYNHHRSMLIGHGNVNGVNFWHDNNPTRSNLGEVHLKRAEASTDGARALLHTENIWVAKSTQECLLRERRDIAWTAQ